ncbi:MAG: hypothetical protein K8U03_23940 [Planctomycetia bacterium]|nr:hypothetical protein [Planctomycetia bacterium]
MIESLTRIIASFVLTAACYTAYAVAVVPFVEPAPPEANGDLPALTETDFQIAQEGAVRQRADLAYWFRDGDWELDTPYMLETSQGKLLFRDHRPRDDGLWEINPCSMVLLSNEPGVDPELRKRRATVLRAPEGALLRFETPIDLKQGTISKLIGGELLGEVEITSGQKLPGPEDDLKITTRDVMLSETHISTPHMLEYRLGTHRGRGRGVLIEMNSEKTPGVGESQNRGIKTLTLQEQVYVHLEPDANSDLFPGRSSEAAVAKAPAERGAKPSPPVDIRCSGAFTFDMVKNIAVFRKQVDVTRLNPGAESDQINGDLLTIYFTSEAPPTAAGVPDPNGAAQVASKKLEPSRIEVIGEPVVIRAPSNRLQARAQYVEHILATRSVKLRDSVEAIVRQDAREIRSPELTFVPDAAGGYGTMLAQGKGRLIGSAPDDPAQTFEAEWTSRFYFRPHEGQPVLSIEGNARVEVPGKGTMAASQIHLWFKEVPKSSTTPLGTQPLVDLPAVDTGKKPRTELQADRLLALEAVHIDSPQMVGDIERLEGWFEHTNRVGMRQAMYRPAGDIVLVTALLGAGPLQFPDERPTIVEPKPVPMLAEQPRAAGLSGAVPLSTMSGGGIPAASPIVPRPGMAPIVNPAMQPQPNNFGQAAAPAAPPEPQPQYHIRGELARMLINVEDRVMRVREVVVEKNVKLTETRTKLPTEQPLLIQGDTLQLSQASPTASYVVVTGTPAYVEARGMTMSGGKLTLDRPNPQTNLLGVPCQGVMTLPVDRDLQGKPTGARELLNLTWQGGLTFDGLTAKFERGVEARLATQYLRTDRMDVIFNRPVAMGESDGNQPPPDIERVNCYDGAFVESRTFEGPELKSVDRLTARTLALHRPSGDFAADGPGEVVSVRLGKPKDPAAPPASNQPVGNAGIPAIPIGFGDDDQAANAKPTINYLNTRFQRSLKGNEIRREMTFSNQVRVLYGPVPQWNAVIDPDRPEQWAQQTVLIDADQLQVNAVRDSATNTDSYNLVAEGNTLVEGNTFTARAPRLTYAQAKDLLVIEGDARTDAELHHQKKIGGQNSDTKAQRFMIWPSTNRVQVDGATFLDLTP